jgi:hypothetical protein
MATLLELASKVGASNRMGKALIAIQVTTGFPSSSVNRMEISFFSTWLMRMLLIQL